MKFPAEKEAKITLALVTGLGTFIQSESNLCSVDACLLRVPLQTILPLKTSKDSSAYTVPVCSVAQGECAGQKPQIEDSL